MNKYSKSENNFILNNQSTSDYAINESEYLSEKNKEDKDSLISSNTLFVVEKQNSNQKLSENEVDGIRNSESAQDKIRKELGSEQISSPSVTDSSTNLKNSCVSSVEKNNSEINRSSDIINQIKCDILLNKTNSLESKNIEQSHMNLSDISEDQESKKRVGSRKDSVCIDSDTSKNMSSNCGSLLPDIDTSIKVTRRSIRLSNLKTDSCHEKIQGIDMTNESSLSKNADNTFFKGRKLKKDTASRKVSVAFGLELFNFSDNKSAQFNEDKEDSCSNESSVANQAEDKKINSIKINETDKEPKIVCPIEGTIPNKENADNISVTNYSVGDCHANNALGDSLSFTSQEMKRSLTSHKISNHFCYDTSIQVVNEGTGTEIVNDDSKRICEDTDCSLSKKKQPVEEQFKISVKAQEDVITEKCDKNENVTSNISSNNNISEGISTRSQSKNNIILNNKSTRGIMINECENLSEKVNNEKLSLENACEQLDSNYIPQETESQPVITSKTLPSHQISSDLATGPSINMKNSSAFLVEKNNSEIKITDKINLNKQVIIIDEKDEDWEKEASSPNFKKPTNNLKFKKQEGKEIYEDENGLSISLINMSRKRKKSDAKGTRRSVVTFATTARVKSDSVSREIELSTGFNENRNNTPVNNNDFKETDLGMSVGLSIIHKENESEFELPIVKKICHSTPLVAHKNKNVNDISLNDKPKQNHVFTCPDKPVRILRERSIEKRTLQKSKRHTKDTKSNSNLEI